MMKISEIRRREEEALAKKKVVYLPYLALEKKGLYPQNLETLPEKITFFQEYLRNYKWGGEGSGHTPFRTQDSPGGGFKVYEAEEDRGLFSKVMGRSVGLKLFDIEFDMSTGDLYLIFEDPEKLYQSHSPYFLITLSWQEQETSLIEASRTWFEELDGDEESFMSVKREGEESPLYPLLGSSIAAAWFYPVLSEDCNMYYTLWDNGYLFSVCKHGDDISTNISEGYLEDLPEIVKGSSALMVPLV